MGHRPLKLLVYEHFDYEIGGNQRYLLLLLGRIQKFYGSDLQIVLTVPTEGVLYWAALPFGNVFALQKNKVLSRMLCLWRLVRSHRPDLILSNNDASLLTVLPSAALFSIKIVWNIKNFKRCDWADFICFFASSRILSISPQSIGVKNSLLAKVFKQKVFSQPIGTDLKNFLELPIVKGCSGPIHVLVLIRIHPDKGADTLVDALELLEMRGINVWVRVAGTVPQGWEAFDNDLKSRTSQFDDVQVEWLGWREDVLPLLEWSHILVNPSRSEGVPRSLVEAMAAGRAVVATRVGGVPSSVTDGEEGFLIPPGSGAALADRIAWLAKNLDKQYKMGAAGRIRAREQFDIDHHVHRLKKHFDEIVAKPSSGC